MEQRKRGPVPGSPAANRGGQAVRAKYGSQFFARIGKKGGSVVNARYGQAFYQTIGQKGGTSTRDRGGSAFYTAIGRKGGKSARTSVAGPASSLAPHQLDVDEDSD